MIRFYTEKDRKSTIIYSKCTKNRAIARKPRDAAAVRCGLKLPDTY